MKRIYDFKVTVRLYTEDGQRCFGPGVALLLERVQTHHSLRAAAASMEMAYSKAWRIIRVAEEAFGFKLLSSTIGGPHGGGAVLTPQAESLLTSYRTYESSIQSYGTQKLPEAFPALFSKE